MLADIDSGFGGFATKYLEYVHDECPKVAVLTFATAPPAPYYPKAAASTSASAAGTRTLLLRRTHAATHKHPLSRMPAIPTTTTTPHQRMGVG